jgi:hypothetical protein
MSDELTLQRRVVLADPLGLSDAASVLLQGSAPTSARLTGDDRAGGRISSTAAGAARLRGGDR